MIKCIASAFVPSFVHCSMSDKYSSSLIMAGTSTISGGDTDRRIGFVNDLRGEVGVTGMLLSRDKKESFRFELIMTG